MADIIPFQFNGLEIVAITDEHGKPWWKASDVCQQCGIKNVSDACDRLDPDEKAVIVLSDTAGRPNETLIVNEPGLYALALRSRKPQAKIFRRWITHEVLPALRQTGRYTLSPALDAYPELRAITELVVSTAQARAHAEAAERAAQVAQAKADQADANALRALETQLFYTIAEYVYINKLQSKIPEATYKACSDYLRCYCHDRAIPFRKISIGGKPWQEEYGFHQSVYAEALPGWITRRFAQPMLTVVGRTTDEAQS